jgi:hypothetical protein
MSSVIAEADTVAPLMASMSFPNMISLNICSQVVFLWHSQKMKIVKILTQN